MKKFKFRFEAVEKVRKSREQDTLRALAKAQDVLRMEKNKKEKLKSELEKSLMRRERLGMDPVGPSAFKTEEDFILGAKQRILQNEQAILRATKSVEKAMKNYLSARRLTRMMEVLREKALAAYRDEQRKIEQKRLDDLYTMRFRLQQKECA